MLCTRWYGTDPFSGSRRHNWSAIERTSRLFSLTVTIASLGRIGYVLTPSSLEAIHSGVDLDVANERCFEYLSIVALVSEMNSY